ncbi:hypothetical protein FCL47_04785 [Desulfopila sp. IMCC35006]|uniref:F0F1 ATP synthase subunit B family protein n=1 Tax=Desulfopila sp. IMCC35006 TaxID=2569542 RepID=UPI0010ACE670|nr:hypothetical protein [Desulfopila sp. IMCC35006]TKB27459.1 hypothetical protein FCL47_04785 [Desulfopila sp. IMCC35006]
MLIDWPTVIFQIINFLILIALLKRFLYGPITGAMDKREQQVAARLAEAAKTEKIANERAAELAKEQENFARSREEMLSQAREEVEIWKNNALKHLQAEFDEKRAVWQSGLLAEQTHFLQKLKRIINRQVFLIAQKALTDLADDDLEARLIENFIAKISRKDQGIAALLSASAGQITCITGFPLSMPQKEKLEMALAPFVEQGGNISFAVDRDLGFGLRLYSEDQKWEWNVNRYLLELESEIETAARALSGVSHGQ